MGNDYFWSMINDEFRFDGRSKFLIVFLYFNLLTSWKELIICLIVEQFVVFSSLSYCRTD